MTDRYSGYIVILDHDMRCDDASETGRALMMIKGVISVEPIVADSLSAIAMERTRQELLTKVLKVFERNAP